MFSKQESKNKSERMMSTILLRGYLQGKEKLGMSTSRLTRVW